MRTSHRTSYQTVVVLVLFSVAFPMVQGCVRHGAGRVPAGQEGPEAGVGTEPPAVYPTTLEYSSPKVALRDLHFVFAKRGRLFVEFSQSYPMVMQALSDAYPGFSYEGHEYEFMPADLAPEHQRFVFQNIPETLGENYNVFFPKSLQWQRRTLSGLALHPGWWGFLGVLSGRAPAGSRVGDQYGFAHLIVGLAFKSAKGAKARPMPRNTISEARKSGIADFITEKLAGGDREFLPWVDISVEPPRFIQWNEVFIEYPSIEAVLTIVEVNNTPNTAGGETAQYLFCVLEREGGPVMVPFEEGAHKAVTGGALWFEDEIPETDTAPWESELFTLPDLDGDGGEELLVVSTVSALFKIVCTEDTFLEVDDSKRQYLVKEVEWVYFGP